MARTRFRRLMKNRVRVRRVISWTSGVNQAPVYGAPEVLRCSVQPVDASVSVALGRPLEVVLYDVFFDADPGLSHQDEVTWLVDRNDPSKDRILGVVTGATPEAGRGVIWRAVLEGVR